MVILSQRTTPLTVRITQRWRPGTYQTSFQGYTFPEITSVPRSGSVPQHGLYHGPEGDIVLQVGDYIILQPATGAFAATSWYEAIGFYEEVLNVTP